MFVRSEDLQALVGGGGRPFEEFLYDLIVAEASRHRIPPDAIHWDPRTNIGDGGRDIVIDTSHADPNPRFIPQRPSIWSAKSGKDGTQPATLRQELISPSHPEIRQHLQAGNPYVWCTLQTMSEDEGNALRDKVREVATDPATYVFNPGLVEFRGVTTLYTVLNDHPALIPKHLPELARAFEGVLTLAEWEALDAKGFATPFVDFAARSQIVSRIRDHLRARSGPNVLHLAGLSGIGKTRTVLEACREQADLSGVLYIPRFADLREPLLRHLTRSANLMAWVIIDEVPLDDLRSLTSKVERYSDRLRFVTIGPARRDERGRPSANILVLPEPTTHEGVLEVVRRVGTGITDPVLESIAHFAAHDLRLALMLVEATLQDGSVRDLPIADGDDVWRRVTGLFRNKLGNVDAFRTNYPYLTVAIDIGVKGDLRPELKTVAAQFAVPHQRLDEAIAAAVPCGLGVTTTNFFEPAPRALAGHLFRQQIWRPLSLRLPDFLSALPDRLLRRFVERCQECAGPEREEMEVALASFFLGELGAPDVTRLVNRDRSRLFKEWAELDPNRGLDWLRQAIESATDEQLAALDGNPDGSGGWRGRRQVVWLCESLASFAEYYWTCEAVLFRLAQVETEPSIGNNSTAIWKALHLPVLAFTEVPFPDRADAFLRRLASGDERTLPLILSAAVEALSMPGGRMLPPAIVGGRVVPEPWKPATFDELAHLQRNFGRRVLEGVGRLPLPLLTLGRRAVAANLQAFTRLGMIDALRALLDNGDADLRQEVHLRVRRQVDLRIEAQERRPGSQPDPIVEELRRWEQDLRPVGLAGRIQELTALDYWDALRGNRAPKPSAEPSPYALLARDILAEPNVLETLDQWFASDKARSAFDLGQALGENDQSEIAAPIVGTWLDHVRCRGIVTGYLRGVANRQKALPDVWSNRLERAADDDAEYAAQITVMADVSDAGFRRIMRLVEARRLPPRMLTAFRGQVWEGHVDLAKRSQVLEFLLSDSVTDRAEALGAALSLAESWTDFGEKPLQPELTGFVIRALRDGLERRTDVSAWSHLLASLARTHPKEAADLAMDALTSSGPQRVVLHDLILPTLLDLASRCPQVVMNAVGRCVLDQNRRPYFELLVFSGLFETIGLTEVQRWVGEHGTKELRALVRHLDSPRIQDGQPFIPPVTDWMMGQFGSDERLFREFCLGRHALEVREGHARDRRAALEQSLEPFQNDKRDWVRRWVEFELKTNERDAELDDMMDDRFERM